MNNNRLEDRCDVDDAIVSNVEEQTAVDPLSMLQESLLEQAGVVDNDANAGASNDCDEDDSSAISSDHPSQQQQQQRRGQQLRQSSCTESSVTTDPVITSEMTTTATTIVNGEEDFVANLTEVELERPMRRWDLQNHDSENNPREREDDDGDNEEETIAREERENEEEEEEEEDEEEELSDGVDASEPTSPFVGSVRGEDDGEFATDRRTILRELRAWTTREQQRLSRMHQGADEEEMRDGGEGGDEDGDDNIETIEEMPIIQGNYIIVEVMGAIK